MTDNPAPSALVPPQFPSQPWYKGYCDTVAALRNPVEGIPLVNDQWAEFLRHIKEALPALDGPNYADFHTGLAQLAESFTRAAKMPLSPETRALFVQVYCHDLPHVMILTRNVQIDEQLVIRPISANEPMPPPFSGHSFLRMRSRIDSPSARNLDLEQALATSVNLHMKELTQKVLADLQQWLASTGATGSNPAVLQDYPQFLFARAGSAWKYIGLSAVQVRLSSTRSWSKRLWLAVARPPSA